MKISKEVKTGILVVMGIMLFVFGYNYLKGINLLKPTNVYYTTFDYNALDKSSMVTVMGNSVGKIQDIVYDYDSGKTKVSFTVNGELKFSKNSIVKMYETGLMGGNALAIIISNEGEQAQPGDYLKSEVEFGLITSLTKNFSGISSDLGITLKSTDTLMISLNKLVNDDSAEGLKQTIAELNTTLKSFKNTSNSVNNVVSKNEKNIAEVLENFKTISKDLTVLMAQLKDADMGEAVASLRKTLENLNNVLASVEKGEGSMGKLLKDDALYNNLEGATLQMEQLLEDMKLNPKRYVHFSLFGKKAKQYDAEGNEIKSKD